MYYRRARQAGGTYFFTVNLQDRSSHLLTDQIALLRLSFARVMQSHPFQIDAIVILPDHLHAIWTLPVDDHDYATRWRLIKKNFSRQIPKHETISLSRQSKNERAIWQRRYWEHQIRDENDLNTHINYIHYNPVKHGHVLIPADWPYSSIHRFIRNRLLERDWGSREVFEGRFGER
ncbi:transposase [Pontibacterium sp.]|uniref:REP-associated tyrosine transposase n=1 Tax=Pontibacterium sp. TaxID=2036026 RepID=UPI0035115623